MSLSINQNQNFGTHNTSSRSGKIEYIAIHYIGATGDAKANINYYNQKTVNNASADFYVGHTGDIWQYNPNPLTRYCWAVGGNKQSGYGGTLYGKAKNSNCVSIEMCVKNKGNKTPNSPDWYFTKETVDATVELTKYLMKTYNIPAERVIRHFDVNGKFCPGVVGWNAPSGSEQDWLNFKARIMAGSTQVAPTKTTAEEKKEAAKSYPQVPFDVKVLISDLHKRAKAQASSKSKGFLTKGQSYTITKVSGNWGKLQGSLGWVYLKNPDYLTILPRSGETFKVKVTASSLRIRKGPGAVYGIVNSIRDNGIYTITEVKGDWGKLKSGAGWICLKYTERV